MTTRMLKAQRGVITDEMQKIARKENLSAKFVRDEIAAGRIVILNNKRKELKNPIALGKKLRTKVNAEITCGFEDDADVKKADKLRVIQTAKADCVSDLSYIKKENEYIICENAKVSNGIYPLFQVQKNNIDDSCLKDEIFSLIEQQCNSGVDFVCLPCSINKNLLEEFFLENRLSDIVSPSVKKVVDFILNTEQENPFYEYFDELLEILFKYDVTLFLEYSFKSGSVIDNFDNIQLQELAIISKLIKKAHKKGVQVVLEGIGHTSMDKIPNLIKTINQVLSGIPLYISSCFVCDAVINHDDMVNFVGASCCANLGIAMINSTARFNYEFQYSISQIKKAIVNAQIVAHCADFALGNTSAYRQSYKVAYARKNKDYKNVIKNSIDKTIFDEH